MDDELKEKLTVVLDKYKTIVDIESKTDSKIRQLSNKLKLTSNYTDDFADELIEISNKHMKEHNINDNTEIKELLKLYINDFRQYGLLTKK